MYRKAATSSRLVVLSALVLSGYGLAEELPADPAEIPAALFAQLPQVSGPKLSPDGNYIAYFRPIEGRRFLIIQKLFASEPPTVVPTSGPLDFRWVEWANNERLVFSLEYADKRFHTETTETRLLATHRGGGDLVTLIKPAAERSIGSRIASRELPPPQIQDKVIDWLVDEPNHILVAVDENQDARYEVRRVDIRTGDYEIETSGQRGIQEWMVDGQHKIRVGYGYDLADYIVLLRSTDDEWRRAETEHWWEAGYRPVGFSDDPAQLYVDGPNEKGIDVLRVLDINTGSLGEIVFEHEFADTSGYSIDPRTGQLTAVSYVDDFVRSHYLDDELVLLHRSINRALSQTVNHLTSWSDNRRRILVHAFSDVEPGAYYLWDRDARSLDIVAAAYDGLPTELLSPVQEVSFSARDGADIPAYLTLPKNGGESGLPVIVLPHGGPEARSDRSFSFLVQFLASRGYAVLQPNFRGSAGYGAAYAKAGRNEWGGLMQDDVTDAARWIIEEGIADPERMCIAGWSYGGYAAAMAAVKTPDLFQCAASINGVLNLPRLIADDRDYVGGRAWTRHMGLSGERASRVSPYHQADKIRIPMLIIQAEDDTRVHADQGKGMVSELRKQDKPVTYVEVGLGGHSMNNEPARLTILESMETFFAAHIGENRVARNP